jgi:hypothetical protein
MSFATNYPFTPNKIHLNRLFTGSTLEKHHLKLNKFQMILMCSNGAEFILN